MDFFGKLRNVEMINRSANAVSYIFIMQYFHICLGSFSKVVCLYMLTVFLYICYVMDYQTETVAVGMHSVKK